MTELWQLFNESGKPLKGKGAEPEAIMTEGLLHGAAHVWIWRTSGGTKQVL